MLNSSIKFVNRVPGTTRFFLFHKNVPQEKGVIKRNLFYKGSSTSCCKAQKNRTDARLYSFLSGIYFNANTLYIQLLVVFFLLPFYKQ